MVILFAFTTLLGWAIAIFLLFALRAERRAHAVTARDALHAIIRASQDRY